jgi:dTDP-4-dehydrorhamnose 3,5-epimerase-like enzyme
MDYKAPQFDLKTYHDPRGTLIPIEAVKDVPIDFKRVYFIKGMPADIKRGAHAHIKTKQVVFCVSGSCRMSFDDGKTISYETIEANKSYLIDVMIWHEMDQFSPDCVIVVFADHYYEKDDYIADYNEFKRLTK